MASFFAWRSRTRMRASCTSERAWRRSSLSLRVDRMYASSPNGIARTRSAAPTKPSIVTSLRSRTFIWRMGAFAMSLPSRGAGRGVRRRLALLLGRGLHVFRALEVDLHQVLLALAPDHLGRALDLRVAHARVLGERRGDGLRLGDRPGDAADHDVTLLEVEFLDVVRDRRGDGLRQAGHHVEPVGVGHRVFVAQGSLFREQVLRLLGARGFGPEDLLGHGRERARQRVALPVRLVDPGPPAEDEAHEEHRGEAREHRDALANPGEPALEGERPPPQVQALAAPEA